MEELVISGKRFISSRQAAKEHKYHPDYIGQLIRAGKISGQKVGRAWYVDVEALERYFSGEQPIPIHIETRKEEVFESIAIHHAVKEKSEEPVKITSSDEKETEIKIPINVSRPTVHYTISEIKTRDEIHPTVNKLTYIADSSPFLPRIDTRPAQKRSIQSVDTVTLENRIVEKRQTQAVKRKTNNRIIPSIVLFLLGVITIVAIFIASVGIASTYTLQNSGVQSSYTFDSAYLASLLQSVK